MISLLVLSCKGEDDRGKSGGESRRFRHMISYDGRVYLNGSRGGVRGGAG